MNGHVDRSSTASVAVSPASVSDSDVALVKASGTFDESFYLAERPDVAMAGVDPVRHYLSRGWREGVDPGPGFSTEHYLDSNADVRAAGLSPLVHYLRSGKAEGRRPVSEEVRRARSTETRVSAPVAPTEADWTALVATRPVSKFVPYVDVLVPVYGGRAETMRCLYSVLAAPQRTPFSLVVVDDHGPDPELRSDIRRLAQLGLIDLHETPENQGFVGACNLGLALHPERDVVLLNSDTEVHNDWLDRLEAAATADARTGTVTPLSNNAEICSYPRTARDNWRRLEVSDAELDRLAAHVNVGETIDVPTGVGFCMYVRRACLNEIGFLDRESFGLGYGEENDLCRRAAEKGWRNVLAPNVFVRHYGATSFGGSKGARVTEAILTVERMHPGYGALVSAYVAEDPARPARERLDLARMASRVGSRGAVLKVLPPLGGGTVRHAEDMAKSLEDAGVPVFFLRPSSRTPGGVKFYDPLTSETVNVADFSVDRDLGRFVQALGALRVAHVHVHHLLDMPDNTGDFLRVACGMAGVAYDMTVHDYTPICPRVNLVDRGGVYCGEPELASCETCVARDGSRGGATSVWEWRERHLRFMSGARRLYVPDEDVAKRMRRHMPTLDFKVMPHPEPMVASAQDGERRRDRTSLHVVVIGALGSHKGSQVLYDCALDAKRRSVPIRFTIVGYTDRDDAFRSLGNVEISGPYEEETLPALLADIGADLAFFPAIWPETYSYTLSAAVAAGIHPVAFDLGAISTRLRALEWGTLLDMEVMLDPPRLVDELFSVEPREATDAVRAFGAGLVYPDPWVSYYGLGHAAGRSGNVRIPAALDPGNFTLSLADEDDCRLEIGDPLSVHHLTISMGKGASVTIDEGCVLGHLTIHASAGSRVHVGKGVGFNGSCRLLLHEPKAITIGDRCLFAGEVDVTVSDMHPIHDLETGGRINGPRDVVIGDDVWIGQRTTVLKGASIGDGTVVGAGSVVSGTIPRNVVAAGVPARPLGGRRVEWFREFAPGT